MAHSFNRVGNAPRGGIVAAGRCARGPLGTRLNEPMSTACGIDRGQKIFRADSAVDQVLHARFLLQPFDRIEFGIKLSPDATCIFSCGITEPNAMQQSKKQRSTVYFVFQVATRPGRIFTFEISPDVDQADLLLDIRQTRSLNGRRADTMAVAFDSVETGLCSTTSPTENG